MGTDVIEGWALCPFEDSRRAADHTPTPAIRWPRPGRGPLGRGLISQQNVRLRSDGFPAEPCSYCTSERAEEPRRWMPPTVILLASLRRLGDGTRPRASRSPDALVRNRTRLPIAFRQRRCSRNPWRTGAPLHHAPSAGPRPGRLQGVASSTTRQWRHVPSRANHLAFQSTRQ